MLVFTLFLPFLLASARKQVAYGSVFDHKIELSMALSPNNQADANQPTETP